MTFKDKPKRGAGKPFDRETKPRAGAKPGPAGKKRPDFTAGAEKPSRKPAAIAPAVAEEGKPERISKILARAGVASRRDVERMIMEGRVKLNGTILETPVINATLEDKIEVDGEPIRGIERTRLWLYHKPAGLVTTNSDPEGRPTVFDNLPDNLPRVLSIGRLDINTEGLLLLTNDGGLSRVLELPTTGWLRRYRVRAHGEVDQEALDKLKEGIAVDGVLYGSIEATLDRTQGRNVWITMGLREGKNREIKNVLGALGLEVNRLIRISYGPFQLGDLPEGEVLEVRGRTLRDQLGPRLIEDSKANFDAPLYQDKPAGDEKPVHSEKAERGGRPLGGKPEDRREKALGRLDTRRDDRKFSDKPKGEWGRGERGRDDREVSDRPKKRPPAGTSRTANVWMAPGARPTADGKVKKTSARAEAERLFDKPKGNSERRVVVNRAEDDSDWIRAEAPVRRPREDEGGDFGRKRSFGDRPPRGERSFGDKPRFDRKPRDEGDRPRAEKSFGAEGRSERPRGDRPFGDKPFRDKPRGDRSFGDKPFGDKPRGGKPSSGKPAGGRGKPGGGKSFGKSFGGKPGGGKPSGGKPSGGGRPGGGRTSGKPRTPRG